MRLRTILGALCVAMLPFAHSKAQVKFIDYKTTTMKAVLAQAEKEKKYIFVDIWTPWCGVCKMIARTIFPRKDVGDYFNSHFINLTFDAENPQWTSYAMNYNATAFPTMLILNSKGEVVSNIDNVGIPRPDESTRPKSRVADAIMEQAANGVAWDTMSDSAFVSKENWEKLSDQEPAFDTRVYARMIQLKPTLSKLYPGRYERLMKRSLSSAAVNMMNSINHRSVPNAHKVAQYREVVEKLNLSDKAVQLLELDLSLALNQRQWSKALQLCQTQKSILTPELYAGLMDGVAGGCSDKAILRQTLAFCAGVPQLKLSERERSYVMEAYNALRDAAK